MGFTHRFFMPVSNSTYKQENLLLVKSRFFFMVLV
jgi:hypothetical protein